MEVKLKAEKLTPEKIAKEITRVFSDTNGCFGRVSSWGQRPTKYVYIACHSDTDLTTFIKNLDVAQQKGLMRMLSYFEIHMKPLKHILDNNTEITLDKFFAETAWSHFATVIMFGLLEVAVKVEKKMGVDDFLGDKGKGIKEFFVKYLDVERKQDVVGKYKPVDPSTKLNSFDEVVQDMWDEYRSGFVHSVGVHSVPHEPASFVDGGEKDGIPVIAIRQEVPMFKWLILTWQAIFNSLGFQGKLDSN